MLKVYLGDLVYDTIKTNFTVPLNVAYVAAYAKEKLGKSVEISLFKYPTDLEKAMKESPPDVLGLSYYSWNARLDLAFLKMAKKLNPAVVTVMGGPNVRTDLPSMEKFMRSIPELDYYIIHEGEEPFTELLTELLKDKTQLPLHVAGCARVTPEALHYQAIEFGKRPREMVQPSPYLTGLLDPFISDANMLPLFETNRGCPFGCTYCAWGVAALSKVRQRPMEEVLQEIDYVGQKSAKQHAWIFCDANFGILQRDLEIADKIKDVMDTKGFPASVTLWHAKNTGQRNIDIVKKIGGLHEGYVAIQSTDQEVLKHSGRGTMRLAEFKKVIDHYKENNLPVNTDLLVGLPGESYASHVKSICEAFDLGFDSIHIYNIRMLPGTKYETDEWRKNFGVITKYRPIYGSYGEYDGERVFELEESIRATKDMSEQELNDLKILHMLVAFAWNSGYFAPLLRYGKINGVNPGHALHELTLTKNPVLRKLFDQMKADSLSEWFETPEEMLAYFDRPENYDRLVTEFMKLHFLYLARIFSDKQTVQVMKDELMGIIAKELELAGNYDPEMMAQVSDFMNKTMCQDLFEEMPETRVTYSGKVAAALFSKKEYTEKDEVVLGIFRSKEAAALSRSMLQTDLEREQGYSIHAMVRLIEMGGLATFLNKVRPISEEVAVAK